MEKTLSIGLMEHSSVNYISFKLDCDVMLEKLCHELAAYIIYKYSNNLINMIINKNYGYLNNKEKTQIYKIAQHSFSNIRLVDGALFNNIIQNNLYEYLTNRSVNTIVLDGFVLFRLGEYQQQLENIVDLAVDEYLIMIEHENLIKTIKEFIRTQKAKYRLIHICSDFSGRYFICDENFEELTESQFLEDVAKENNFLINSDDLLLTALINIAPKKIVFHKIENVDSKDFIDTLIKLFENKIIFCKGCSHCKR